MSLRILLSILFIYWTLLLLGQIQIYSNFFSIYLITALSHIDEEIDNWLRVFLSVPTPHSAKCMECNFAILAKSFLLVWFVGFCKRCFPSMWQKTILDDEFTKFMKMQSNSLVDSGHTLKKSEDISSENETKNSVFKTWILKKLGPETPCLDF